MQSSHIKAFKFNKEDLLKFAETLDLELKAGSRYQDLFIKAGKKHRSPYQCIKRIMGAVSPNRFISHNFSSPTFDRGWFSWVNTMYLTPFKGLPLRLNSASRITRLIVSWRFQIDK